MSPIELPLGIAMVALGVGSLIGIVAYAGIAELIERWRKR